MARPFESLPRETDWVAFRELVPAGTLRTRTVDGEAVTFATVLPLAWPAIRRVDGSVMVGIQSAGASTDPSRDLAAALDAVLAATKPGPIGHLDARSATARLQDRLDLTDSPELTVHEGFDFWLDGLLPDGDPAGEPSAEPASEPGGDEAAAGLAALAPQVRASLERANEAVVPTEPLTAVRSGYWARIGETAHIRWVITEPEDRFLDGLARLHARREDQESSALGPGSRYAGSFRAHGLVVPVWDVDPESSVEALEEPMAALAERLAEAMATTSPLDAEQRRARAGLVSRQITLR